MTWRENSNNPVWMRRARRLAEVLAGKELSAAAVISLGSCELGWSQDETRNVLAAAEGRLLSERGGYWRVNGMPSVRPAVAPPKKKEPRPPRPSLDGLDASMVRFESIACECGERTFHRKGGGYVCSVCAHHYPDWGALTRPRPPTDLVAAGGGPETP